MFLFPLVVGKSHDPYKYLHDFAGFAISNLNVSHHNTPRHVASAPAPSSFVVLS